MKHAMKIALMCGMALVFVLASETRTKGDDGWGDGNTNTKPTKPEKPENTTPTTPSGGGGEGSDAGIVPDEITRLNAAKKILAKAQGDYDTFVAAKKTEFESSADFVTAKKAVEEDEKTLVAVKTPLQEQLKATNSAYASAMTGLEDAKKKLEEAVASRKADDIAYRKFEVNRMQETIRKAEEAFAKNAGVTQAQTKLTEDQRVLASMQQKFQEYLNGSGDYVALSSVLAKARARVAALTKGKTAS
ncbi:MAG: hypothetical protein FWD61_17625 [Phycisphaerales bacterium]|nr:hypothetical protein [Phycisphaerales bacterium]